MKILITGGAGFIGSHLGDAFLANGHTVAILDNFSSGKESNVPQGVKVYRGDITDYEFVKKTFAEFKPDVVSHHAAQLSVAASVREPIVDAELNILGTIVIVEAALAIKARKIIFSSSAGTVYGDVEEGSSNENSALNPSSPYGLSKHTAERYIRLLTRGSSLAYTILRYSNVFGPRQDPHGEAGVCAIFSLGMLENKELVIFGEGAPIRDYIYIEDVVTGNLAVLENGDGQEFNICTGQEISTADVFNTLKEAFNYTKAPHMKPWREGDIKRVALSPEKAGQILNWKAVYTFQEGIDTLVTWYKSGEIR